MTRAEAQRREDRGEFARGFTRMGANGDVRGLVGGGGEFRKGKLRKEEDRIQELTTESTEGLE